MRVSESRAFCASLTRHRLGLLLFIPNSRYNWTSQLDLAKLSTFVLRNDLARLDVSFPDDHCLVALMPYRNLVSSLVEGKLARKPSAGWSQLDEF